MLFRSQPPVREPAVGVRPHVAFVRAAMREGTLHPQESLARRGILKIDVSGDAAHVLQGMMDIRADEKQSRTR